jgi:hypothetical protein
MRSALLQTCAFGLLIASLLSYATPISGDYSRKTVTDLIDDLTQIESESWGISSSYMTYMTSHSFIAEDTPSFLRDNGEVALEVPPPMRELVRRGPLALPELIKHLDDKRPTKLVVGFPPPGVSGVFVGKVFGYQYDPRVHDWEQKVPGGFGWTEKWFKYTYVVKVGDICFALIGQIVNRHLLAVRPQPTGWLVVNSPIEVPDLVEKVKSDWGSGDAETVKASLLADVHRASQLTGINQDLYIETVANPALRRLKLYFPEDYRALPVGGNNKKSGF